MRWICWAIRTSVLSTSTLAACNWQDVQRSATLFGNEYEAVFLGDATRRRHRELATGQRPARTRRTLRQPHPVPAPATPTRHRRAVAHAVAVPGGRVGRPLSAVALGSRLRDLGIQPQRMRLVGLDQLIKEIPPAMLAGILGIPARAAIGNTTRAGGAWARYGRSPHMSNRTDAEPANADGATPSPDRPSCRDAQLTGACPPHARALQCTWGGAHRSATTEAGP
jgi:hypothetical protein